MTAATPRLLIALFSLILLITFTINIARSSNTPPTSASAEISTDGDMKMTRPPFPPHWGPPPLRQTRDLVPLPEPYGRGSGTLRKWILEKMAEDDAVAGTTTTEKSSATDGKLWPDKDLVGMTGDDAKAEVLRGKPNLSASNIHILPHDAMVTMDYRVDRVRIFTKDGKVERQPMIG